MAQEDQPQKHISRFTVRKSYWRVAAAIALILTSLAVWQGWFNSNEIAVFAQSERKTIELQDGSNTAEWNILGSDTYQGGWVLVVFDPASVAPDIGTGVALSTITNVDIKPTFTSSPKNVDNTWVDYLVAGNGYTIVGGTAGDPVTWDDIATVDNASGFGVVQKIGGVFFVNGALTFGSQSTGLYFQDQGETIVFLDEPVDPGLYKINIRGCTAGTGNIEFIMGDVSNSGDDMLGYDGCSISAAEG